METQLRYLAFAKVASTPDGRPVYSLFDILEPLPRSRRSLLRNARLTADSDGYVLVGDATKGSDTYRKIPGLYRRPRDFRNRRAA